MQMQAPQTVHTPAAAPSARWIPVMVDRIVAGFHPLKVVLFGSHARGEADAGSDIDLLVVLPDGLAGIQQREATIAVLGALSDLPVAKDIVVTTPDEIARRGHLVSSVLYYALREGQVLYERP